MSDDCRQKRFAQIEKQKLLKIRQKQQKKREKQGKCQKRKEEWYIQ